MNMDIEARKLNRYLQVACIRQDFISAKLLIERGADVNPSEEDTPPILIPTYLRKLYPDFLKLLIKNGAYLSVVNDQGNIPLHLAPRWGNANAVKILSLSGASVEELNNQNETPLWATVNHINKRAGRKCAPIMLTSDAVKILISHGSNICEKFGESSLMDSL
ncbi:MAG: ankyrin repeat domain-containing protein [Rickettsiaceae bacterium]|nr:ankyrin repeat domain-containing protein [Rickettsiaceae bacterium]